MIEVVEIAGEDPAPMTTVIDTPANPIPEPPPVVVAEPAAGPGCWSRFWNKLKVSILWKFIVWKF